jgi:uridylate kinase
MTYIISLGGSLIAPPTGLNHQFLKKFRSFILDNLKSDSHSRFFIVTGGGSIARRYIAATDDILPATADDCDWLGIHATRLNAHLLRTILRDVAYPEIIVHPDKELDFKTKKVIIAGGYHPGFSTDTVAVLLAKKYGATKILNLSNIDYVYDKDPYKYKTARPRTEISWLDFTKLVGHKWQPGLNTPFDPVASKMARAAGLEVAVISGRNLKTAQDFFQGRKFIGTLIK